jgi:ribosome biogenesis GTPase / thiamine phosphate phosphatase
LSSKNVWNHVAKKSKLTQQQQRRVKDNQSKRRQRASDRKVDTQDMNLGAEQGGILIRRYGAQADVENNTGGILRCQLRRNLGEPVAGDRVVWREIISEDDEKVAGVIVALQERHSVLKRPVPYAGLKAIAANIDQMLIVNANPPGISLDMIDRYLVASHWLNVPAVLIFNKCDGYEAQEKEQLEQYQTLYQKMGLKVLFASAKSGEGIDDIRHSMQNKTSIFVGQSGVGKSSLINNILGYEVTATKNVSETSGLGVHTTTAACLYRMTDSTGSIIDSPGIREFGLDHMQPNEVFNGFQEFETYRYQCKFRNCSHKNEPGCAIQTAVEAGEIAQSRYQSFIKIIESAESS